jgi:predicted RND superfamily exporter protein
LGIGLDDSFIMSGAYDRTDPSKGPKERIYDTVQDVGISITVSTITTTLAFGLGCISTIPTIYWLCLYAFPTVMCVYIYQLTFFVACIVLDERRIQQHRHDCCTWINVDDDGEDDDDEQEEQTEDTSTTISGITEKYILLYADILLRPRVKTIVVLLFTGLAAACIFSVSLLSQEMDLTKILPSDSYLTAYMDAVDVYSEMGMRRPPYAYFRFVDQSNETVQMHMENYVNDFVSIAAVSSQPGRFWLRDFKGFVNTSDAEEFGQLDFNSKVDAFLSDPVFGELYRRDIVRDKYLTITASRCLINMNNVDILDVHDQVKAFEDQQRVAAMSPVNQGREDLAFFSYSEMYEPWVFYTVAVDELILTTVIGVVAVTGVSFLFVPHWTAALFVLPLICILYVDLLGVLQWAGVHINAVSYLSMVMSIGLLVDYVIHILFRYYESAGNRKEKTVEMLRTMGSSILMGGISTFLGTLPLAFCTSDIFSTVFFGFMGLVTLGCGHGLILMPVILSTIGPEDHHVVLEVKPESDRVQSDLKREIERTKIMEIDDPPVFLASSLPVSL